MLLIYMDKNKGQSLVEALIAVAVVIILITGIVAGTTSSLRASAYARARSEATKLVQQGMEIARNDRDQGWSDFADLDLDPVAGTRTYYCVGSVSSVFGNANKNYTTDAEALSYCESSGSISIPAGSLNISYVRFLVFEINPAGTSTDTMWVRTVVRWREGSNYRTSQAETYMTSAWE
jgi:type II secretory pathway pseudopilin PulG